MCGIAGILEFDSSKSRPNIELLRRMLSVLIHRGPDDAGLWRDQQIALGHRRLSIIDLSAQGRQPMSNEDGSVHLTYNGELYNFKDLITRFSLIERGHQFRSRTDSEVLIHLYEELDLQMLPELNGMYAFALWDSAHRKIHLVRDRYGIKPLFYACCNDKLIFASEIKAILQDAEFERRINLQAMHDFFSFNYIPGTQTAFEGIYEVPPGHVLTARSSGELKLERYWKPSYRVNEKLDENTAAETALKLMERAVRRQLVADVPVGVMLSGGLDSSAITALAARSQSAPLQTFSIGFDDRSYNELPFAEIVAQEFGTSHHEVVITPELVSEMLPQYLSYIDEPYADGSAIPTFYISRLARQSVKVLLSGEGGDEVFAGYETHAALKAARIFKRIPHIIRQNIFAPLVNRLPVSDKKLSFEFRAKRFLGGQELPPAEAHLWWRIVLTENKKCEIYNPEIFERFTPLPSVRFFQDVFAQSNAGDDLNKILNIDSAVFLPDDLMIKNDRMTMANSIEARVPLTDNDLADFMETVPPRLKLKGLKKKYIMRQALKNILPRAILDKKKVGLEMPYSGWLRAELKDLMLDYCAPRKLKETRIFDEVAVHKLIAEHLSGKLDHGRFLWGLLNYMMWLDLYFAPPAYSADFNSVYYAANKTEKLSALSPKL